MDLNPKPVVNGEVTAPVSEDVTPQVPGTVVPEPTTTTPAPAAGDKTESALLLENLRVEREKRRLAEAKIALLEEEANNGSTLSEDVQSDEGKILSRQIKTLQTQLSDVAAESARKDILIANPILKDKWEEFEEFRSNPDNKGMNMRTAAKAFLVENGLLDVPRKGLEQPSGGQRTVPKTGMTAEDVRILRETNFKKYQEMLKAGQIVIT